MRTPGRLTISALVALLAPGVLLAVGTVAAGALPDQPLTSGDWLFLLKNWLFFATPQLLVLALAYFYPNLRRSASASLIALTALCACLLFLVFYSRDPNSGMLLIYYFPLSALVAFAAMFLTWRRGAARGSNNRWRGP